MSVKPLSTSRLQDIQPATWEKVSNLKFFFGHKSVGQNIVDGLSEIMSENPQIKLKIVKTRDKADFAPGIFAHDSVGNNMDFQSKVDDFQKLINDEITGNVDIAFQKFCYIDFDRGTDSQKIFDAYKTSIMELKRRNPSIKFIHTTVPLVAIQTGPKAWIKKIIGRPLDGIEDNIKRFEYNQLIRKNFVSDPIFDIAKAESTYPDGSMETFIEDGKTYYAMVPSYTDDGGHLNKDGSRHVAIELLTVLAKVVSTE